ncbi:MAG: hypothetical protein AAF074_20720 [Pseudomonadota bacterium]
MARRFAGTHEHKVEQRGRVAMPALFRKVLRDLESPGVYLVPQMTHDRAHVVFSEPGFDAVCARIEEAEVDEAERALMLERVMGRAAYLELDEAGRFVLPQALRDSIGIAKEIVIIGLGDRFELRSPAWQAERAADSESRGRSALAGLNLGRLH